MTYRPDEQPPLDKGQERLRESVVDTHLDDPGPDPEDDPYAEEKSDAARDRNAALLREAVENFDLIAVVFHPFKKTYGRYGALHAVGYVGPDDIGDTQFTMTEHSGSPIVHALVEIASIGGLVTTDGTAPLPR